MSAAGRWTTERHSAPRDILLATWLMSRMRTPTDITAEEYCRAMEELAPARPFATAGAAARSSETIPA